MWSGIDRVGGVMRDATLAVTALTGLVALAMLGCRQPARRVLLARAGVLCTMALIPLHGLAPLPRVEVIAAIRGVGLLDHPILSGRGLVREAPGRRTPQASHLVPPTWPGPPWAGRALVVGYLAGLGVGLTWLILGYWGLGWLVRNSTGPSPEVGALFDTLAPSGRIGRPRLRVSDRVRRPVLLGLLRRTILIPRALDRRGDPDSLRLSLLHELAHAEGSDPWFTLAANLAQAVWFFVPTLWWVRSQLRLDHEFLADRRAAVVFGALPSYASSLLELAASGGPTSSALPCSPAFPDGEGSALFRRILMLVQCPFPVEARPPGWWSWSLPVVVVLGTLAASCLSLRTSEWPSSSPTPPRASASTHTFRLRRLVVRRPLPGVVGAPRTMDLPVHLPDHFDLSVDVWGDRITLGQCRLIGHPLRQPEGTTGLDDTRERWHRVRFRREAGGIHLWIDGEPVPAGPDSTTTGRLSVTPPEEGPGRFQDLILTWE